MSTSMSATAPGWVASRSTRLHSLGLIELGLHLLEVGLGALDVGVGLLDLRLGLEIERLGLIVFGAVHASSMKASSVPSSTCVL